jgi:hypothetical protein
VFPIDVGPLSVTPARRARITRLDDGPRDYSSGWMTSIATRLWKCT